MAAKRKKAVRKDRIAILGTTPSRMQAPIGEKDWEIWTIGPGGKDVHPWDILFEVHHVWPENFKDYLNDLSKVEPPQRVVTLRPVDELISNWLDEHGDTPEKREELAQHVSGKWSANMVLPVEQIFRKYVRRMWFSSSISFCIAAAMERGATDIGLFGIDLESGEEYISQFTGAAHLVDLARHKGITVHMPEGCGLDRDIAPYPNRYETNLALTLEKKHNWLGQAIGQLEAQFRQVEGDMYRQEGAILAMEAMKAPEEDIRKARENHHNLNMQQAQMGANLNHLRGEQSATQFYRRMYVWGVTDP